MLKRNVTLLILYLIFSAVHGQEEIFSFNHLGVKDGLSHTVVNCILQDNSGFIWIGTQNGLNRFDGYDIKVYKSNQSQPGYLKNNIIKCLLLDKAGNIWVGTAGGGLHKYLPLEDTFHSYYHTTNDNSICSNNIYSLTEDTDSCIWIGTYGGGVDKFNPRTKTFTHHNQHAGTEKAISDNSVRSVLVASDDKVYFGTESGHIDILNKKSNTIKKLGRPTKQNNAIMYFKEDTLGIIWIGTYGGGLLKYDTNKNTFTSFTAENSKITSNIVWKIFDAGNDKLWIATRGGGINIFNKKNETFKPVYYSPTTPNSLSSNLILDIYKDKSGTFWIGTEDNGINTLNISKQIFKLILPKYIYPKTKANSVVSIYTDKSGKLWIGTPGDGVITYNPKTEQKKHFKTNEGTISNNAILSITEDDNNNIWMGTDGNGVDVYNTKTGTFTNYSNIELDSTSISNNAVYSLLKGKDGTIWLGTYGGGLNRYNSKTDDFTSFKVDPNPMNNVVLSIFEDFDTTLWIGTANNGLASLKPDGHFTFYSHDNNKPESLSNNTIMSITQEQDKNFLWLGTGGSGLCGFNLKKKSFVNFNEDDGLSNDVISSICFDNKRNIWIGTINGLNCFNTITGIFNTYNYNDGLQGDSYNHNACFRDNMGYLYFGGENGISIFHPDSTQASDFSPPIVFTDLRISNEPVGINEKIEGLVVLKECISRTKRINLNYKHTFFSIEFATLDYRNPDKIQYQYMLEGFDKRWVTTDASRRFATYTQLSPGDYTLKVRSTNSDGKWCNNIKTIEISIAPPFWTSTAFFISIIALIIIGIYLFIRFKTIRLKKYNLVLEDKVQERTKEIEAQRDEIYKQTGRILLQQEKILDQKELLEIKNKELEKLSIAASEADSAIVIMNKSGFIEWINEKFAAQYNIDPERNFAKEPLNYIQTNTNNVLYTGLKHCIEKKKSINFEQELVDCHNKKIYTQTSLTPVFNEKNEVECLVSVSTDITNQKIAEQQITKQKDQITKQHNELQIHRDNLEKIVEARTKELKEALYRAEDSDRLKTSFLANISHEIRTPMNSILGFTELLSSPNLDENKKNRYLNLINNNGESLVRLIDDIIDISKIETGQIEFKKRNFLILDRCSVLQTHIENLIQKTGKNIGVELSIAEDARNISIYSDAYRIDQVIINLLSNAVKYTEKGTIRFGYKLIKTDNIPFIQFFTSDTGIGLREEQKLKIFNHFTKIEESKRKLYAGVGLGLTISRHIVELLGGKIWVESEIGVGSCFNFTIPYIQDTSVQQTNFDFANKRILVAEDEDGNYGLIVAFFEDCNVELIRARNGQEAIDLYEKANPDLLLLDIKLPVKDGYEVKNHIRLLDQHTPIIAQTAYSLLSNREKMISEGFSELILKPLHRTNLLQTVNKLLF